MQFASFGLSPAILRAVREEAYDVPTPIQTQTIGPALEGRDVLGCAQTGTGKTAAFALPVLHRLATAAIDKTRRGPGLPRALILSPTRELAGQISESFAAYGRHTPLRHALIFGGVNQFHQVKALQRGVDILVATPGRLIDLMEQRLAELIEEQVHVEG
jgi:ATP-dependent RNA helicase RhlE